MVDAPRGRGGPSKGGFGKRTGGHHAWWPPVCGIDRPDRRICRCVCSIGGEAQPEGATEPPSRRVTICRSLSHRPCRHARNQTVQLFGSAPSRPCWAALVVVSGREPLNEFVDGLRQNRIGGSLPDFGGHTDGLGRSGLDRERRSAASHYQAAGSVPAARRVRSCSSSSGRGCRARTQASSGSQERCSWRSSAPSHRCL
jgi:hypothetical protein